MSGTADERSALLAGDAEPPAPCGACGAALRRVRASRNTAIAIMFLAFMLDLMLLTVIGRSAPTHLTPVSLGNDLNQDSFAEPLLPDLLKTIKQDSSASLTQNNSSQSQDTLDNSTQNNVRWQTTR